MLQHWTTPVTYYNCWHAWLMSIPAACVGGKHSTLIQIATDLTDITQGLPHDCVPTSLHTSDMDLE
jgi:hypothetical protein